MDAPTGNVAGNRREPAAVKSMCAYWKIASEKPVGIDGTRANGSNGNLEWRFACAIVWTGFKVATHSFLMDFGIQKALKF